ncbi:hypothetical protein [Holospora curviuscula]|uniref:Septum formation initiator n=1 Tax=Holospora curviuscula TaxID=1082868 RepID=A0A2S5R6T0_9PROT|nr:hypothetical protein [Holospora curviuscula]PPE02987.1 hypothetical protein HCUR_01567 [Holospora curviuscula]
MQAHWGLSLFFLGMSVYFSYYSVYGGRGCIVWREKRTLLAQKREKVKILQKKKQNLEQKISLFDGEVDSDLLEQMGWKTLGMIPENYYLVTYGK